MLNIQKTCSRSKLPRKKSKVLQNRRKFKRFEDATKTYHQKHSPEETLAWAQAKRQERLNNPTDAERSFESICRLLGINFEREKIIVNGNRCIFIDFLVRGNGRCCFAIEIDGLIHGSQNLYDEGRDRWLLEKHGIKTYRFTNETILKTPEMVIAELQRILTQEK